MDPFGLKVIFITILVFVPLERMFALHREQKAFRRDWANDLVFLLFNGLLIKLGLLAVIAVSIFAATHIVPASFQAAIGGLPYWIQLPLIIVLSDLGFYWTHRGSGGFTPFITASKNSIGWRRRGSIPSIRY